MGRGKVFIVEEADLLTTQAQNALLKTLEEPLGRALIILLTDQPDSLLATVRSRCQLIPFSPLDSQMVARELEKRQIPKTVATQAATFAEGSLGQALAWIQDGVVDHARELVARLDALIAGEPAADLETFFRKSADEYAETQLERDKLASKDQFTREALTIYLHLAANHLRRQLLQTTDPDALERLCSAIDAIARAENYLWSNVNVALALQQLSMALQRDLCGAAS